MVNAKLKYSNPVIQSTILIAALVFSTDRSLSQSVIPGSKNDKIIYIKYLKPQQYSPGQNILLSQKFYDQLDNNESRDEKDTFDVFTGNFTKPLSFTVYQKRLVTKNPVGKVSGVATLCIRSDSIIIRIDELKFIQLKKDRYAQFRPDGRKPVPLERLKEIHHNAEWQEIFNKIDSQINDILNKAEKVFNDNMP